MFTDQTSLVLIRLHLTCILLSMAVCIRLWGNKHTPGGREKKGLNDSTSNALFQDIVHCVGTCFHWSSCFVVCLTFMFCYKSLCNIEKKLIKINRLVFHDLFLSCKNLFWQCKMHHYFWDTRCRTLMNFYMLTFFYLSIFFTKVKLTSSINDRKTFLNSFFSIL